MLLDPITNFIKRFFILRVIFDSIRSTIVIWSAMIGFWVGMKQTTGNWEVDRWTISLNVSTGFILGIVIGSTARSWNKIRVINKK